MCVWFEIWKRHFTSSRVLDGLCWTRLGSPLNIISPPVKMIVGVELVKVFEGSLNSAEPVGEIAVLIILKGMSLPEWDLEFWREMQIVFFFSNNGKGEKRLFWVKTKSGPRETPNTKRIPHHCNLNRYYTLIQFSQSYNFAFFHFPCCNFSLELVKLINKFTKICLGYEFYTNIKHIHSGRLISFYLHHKYVLLTFLIYP